MKRDRIATILAEAVLAGDAATAKKHGISLRSLRRWRQRLATDDQLATIGRQKMAVVEQDWAAELPGAIRKAIAFLATAAERCNPADPDAVHAIAGELKILTDVAMSRRLLDARLSRQDGSARTPHPTSVPAADGERALAH